MKIWSSSRDVHLSVCQSVCPHPIQFVCVHGLVHASLVRGLVHASFVRGLVHASLVRGLVHAYLTRGLVHASVGFA